MPISITPANCNHFPDLQAIELASFETLRAASAVTGEPVASSDEELQYYLDAMLLYVAFNERSAAVGFGGGYVAENWLHVGEVNVHPDWQQKGIGRQLIKTLLREGRARSLNGATLTTDLFAPFNAAFYASLGFHVIQEEACPTRLTNILNSEIARGLDPTRRVAMILAF